MTHYEAPTLLAVRELATCPHQAEQHTRLRDSEMYWEGGELVVVAPGLIAQALVHPALSVVPDGGSNIHPQALRARMARFSDGPEHTRRRHLVKQLLPEAAGLAAGAEREATADLAGQSGRFDVMPLARTVPVRVLAQAIGVPSADLDRLVHAAGELCDALAPALHSWIDQPNPDPAARVLEAVLAATGLDGLERTAAAAGILFQARDATAALIGAAVLDADEAIALRWPGGALDLALRRDAPVQSTRRIAAQDLWLGDVRVMRGTTVWVLLAVAELGSPYAPATFGGGLHACPGSAQALALATGVLAALQNGRWNAAGGQRVRYEPRPNLRVPASVLVERS